MTIFADLANAFSSSDGVLVDFDTPYDFSVSYWPFSGFCLAFFIAVYQLILTVYQLILAYPMFKLCLWFIQIF